MIIKNRDDVGTTELRQKVLDIIEAGIERVLPSTIIESTVKFDSSRRILTIMRDVYDVSTGRVFIIGGGKAAALMAHTLENILSPENIAAGVVNCKKVDYPTSKIKMIESGHPIPDERGLAGVEQMLNLKIFYRINKNDTVICLISGGGSALMPCPVEGVTLKDKQQITDLLLGSGANIHEINAVRKHLSKTKGGGLCCHFAPAIVISLILSDVIGNDLDVIASGQTCADSSTFSMAREILAKYNLLEKAPKNIIDIISRGCRGEVEETPKNLQNCHNYLIGDNTLALEAMREKANELGFNPYVITAEQKGDTTTAAKIRADEIMNNEHKSYNLILIGGETTPRLPPYPGKGGRNQHYAAVSLTAMDAFKGEWVVASVGTDGSDYLPDVAGAIIDNQTLSQAKAKHIDIEPYIARYDSNTLFKEIEHSLIITGNTGTNVGDVIVYALKPKFE